MRVVRGDPEDFFFAPLGALGKMTLCRYLVVKSFPPFAAGCAAGLDSSVERESFSPPEVVLLTTALSPEETSCGSGRSSFGSTLRLRDVLVSGDDSVSEG